MNSNLELVLEKRNNICSGKRFFWGQL